MAMSAVQSQMASSKIDPLEGVAPLASFNDATLDWINTLLAAVNQEWQDVNRDLYNGEHWSPGGVDGAGWVGPRPPIDDPMYDEVLRIIETGFVSSNKVKETANRVVNGVLSREPSWNFTVARPLADGETPTAEEQTLIEEVEAMLTEWWDKRDVLETLQEALLTALLEDRASLRLYLPRSRMHKFANPQDAMSGIFLHHCRPGQAMVYVDGQTMDELGVYAYTVRGQERAEVCWLEGDLTVLRFLGQTKDAAIDGVGAPGYIAPVDGSGVLGDFRLDLGGRLTIHEMRKSLLITEQVRSAQYLLNKALTMLSRNLDTGGFLERTVLNGQMPGHYEEDEESPSGRVWVPDPYRMGPGMTTYIAGLEQVNTETGASSFSTPQLMYRDPVTIAAFEESRRAAFMSILEEVQQLHVAIAGDAAASGESRRQAMAAFVSDLRHTKSKVDKDGRWLIEAAAAMAAWFGGNPGRYAGLRGVFDSHIDPGPIPSDELAQITSRYESRLLSRPSAMALQGVDDVDAEIALIELDVSGDLNFGSFPPAPGDTGGGTVTGINDQGPPDTSTVVGDPALAALVA